MPMTHRRFLLGVVTALAVAACSDSNAPERSHVGSYDLESVNGDRVPSTLFELGSYRIDLTAGALTLAANNTFTNSFSFIEYENGAPVSSQGIVCTGSYARNGSTITLTVTPTQNCDGTVTGTFAGSTITLHDPQFGDAVFRR